MTDYRTVIAEYEAEGYALTIEGDTATIRYLHQYRLRWWEANEVSFPAWFLDGRKDKKFEGGAS